VSPLALAVADSDFIVTFWGTRGTRMMAGQGYSRYGRNTICISVQCGQRLLILDAGSGLVRLGNDIMAAEIKQADIFLTHANYDHIEGIPFFQPLYEKTFHARVHSGRLKGVESTGDIVDGLMKEPCFPIRQEKFLAKIDYEDVEDNAVIDLGNGIEITTRRLHHPGGATGYRINYNGSSFALVTDTTHAPGQRDQEVISLIEQVDLFAYDCSYLDTEFPKFSNYGHSTWEEAIRLRRVAKAKALLGLHHMPVRNDEALDQIQGYLYREDPASMIAHDGMRKTLSPVRSSI
jgi:phosphoribosyl 1,2-cyclic phosphodiesterase